MSRLSEVVCLNETRLLSSEERSPEGPGWMFGREIPRPRPLRLHALAKLRDFLDRAATPYLTAESLLRR